ncbi:MAG: ATP-binding protein [Arcobacter butzleri]|jgi:predicted AAA+ superfamily ATPase|nr:ATP-binding protein [Arcobacteraceae bacterium]MDY0364239.1 ATP-binding protein [Arcobacteraceae bacterium]NLO17586.1 ATP-binding protein [Aliarcobacter butzleri]
MEKLEILEVLNEWNYWNKDLPKTFSRDFYDDKISSFIKNDEILVLKGIRRCGKSTLLLNQIKKLIKQGVSKNDILFINLEDPRFINHLNVEFLQKIKDTYLEYLNPQAKPYIFLDEIQNVPFWEKWVNKEYELKLSNIVITGSNSSMLSGEIATSLSGRYISVEVFPLSFKEFLHFKEIKIASKLDFVDKKIDINRAFEEYLDFGAFPKVLDYEKNYKKELLNTYKESILLNDIVARYKLKSFDTLEELAAFLLSNSGIIQSITKIKNSFNISFDMARDYLEYLKNAYMVFEIRKFDYSLRKQNLNDKKYYSADLGLSNLYRVANLKYKGANLETIVALELIRKGFDIYYYKTQNSLEVDFVVVKNNQIIELIQVSKSLENDKTKSRELAVFQKTIDELNLENVKCTILTEDKSSKIIDDKLEIRVKNILEWLI